MSKKIIITGATGLIGSNISKKLIERGDKVIVFTRNPGKARRKLPDAYEYIKWNYDEVTSEWEEKISDADAVIHLAGESVMANRWTDKHKRKVYESRITGTKNLVDAITETENKPQAFISASAIGYYDNDINKEYDEYAEPGTGFLAKVTEDWENEAKKVEQAGVRRVNIRIGIVLDKNEGALPKMMLPYKFFVGGPLGSGKQWIQWIHIDDVADLFIYALDNNLSGVFNAVSDNVKMKKFAETLGKVLRKPSFFSVPSFVLKLVLGEASDSIIKGSKIIPARTIESRYSFRYTELDQALKNLLA